MLYLLATYFDVFACLCCMDTGFAVYCDVFSYLYCIDTSFTVYCDVFECFYCIDISFTVYCDVFTNFCYIDTNFTVYCEVFAYLCSVDTSFALHYDVFAYLYPKQYMNTVTHDNWGCSTVSVDYATAPIIVTTSTKIDIIKKSLRWLVQATEDFPMFPIIGTYTIWIRYRISF